MCLSVDFKTFILHGIYYVSCIWTFSFMISLDIAFSPMLSSLFWDSCDHQSINPSRSFLQVLTSFSYFYLPVSLCCLLGNFFRHTSQLMLLSAVFYLLAIEFLFSTIIFFIYKHFTWLFFKSAWSYFIVSWYLHTWMIPSWISLMISYTIFKILHLITPVPKSWKYKCIACCFCFLLHIVAYFLAAWCSLLLNSFCSISGNPKDINWSCLLQRGLHVLPPGPRGLV